MEQGLTFSTINVRILSVMKWSQNNLQSSKILLRQSLKSEERDHTILCNMKRRQLGFYNQGAVQLWSQLSIVSCLEDTVPLHSAPKESLHHWFLYVNHQLLTLDCVIIFLMRKFLETYLSWPH